MAKQKMGPFGQKNYSQMGDGHARGKDAILKEGSHAKKPNEKFIEFLKRNPKSSTPPQPSKKNTPTGPQIKPSGQNIAKQIIAAKIALANKPKPTPQVKPISKAKTITRSK